MSAGIGTYEFYEEKFFLRRHSYEYLWSYIFRLCMDPEANEIITFIGDGLKFRILDLKTLALLYYYPHDKFVFNDRQITTLFRSALCKSQAIISCWYKSDDVFDFTSLREDELQFISGMNMSQLLNYAYCVRPLEDDVVCLFEETSDEDE